MIGDIVGGLVGGGIVALLRKDGTMEILNKPSVRRYRGYPSDTAGQYEAGNTFIEIGPPPDGYGWELLAMLWHIIYDAGGAGGNPVINIYRRDGALILPVQHPPRAAGVAVYNYYTQGASYPEFAMAGNAGVVYPLPFMGELKDEQMIFDCDGGVDDMHRVMIYYKEFEL